MNFLEQLVAEWYEYNGYLVRTNIKFGRNATGKGGHAGEIDVVAYKPLEREFFHIEASTDSYDWEKRRRRFQKKFKDARSYYMQIFPFKEINIEPQQIVIVGFNLNKSSQSLGWSSSPPIGSPWGDLEIKVIHIPEFIRTISKELEIKDPQKDAIPETYPLLRAIQYSSFYNKN